MSARSAAMAGQRIADWNQAHGSTLTVTNEPLNAISAAITDYETEPSPAGWQALKDAGARLRDAAEVALASPLSGVSDYDGPRRRGLREYQIAGELLTDATDETDSVLTKSAGHLDAGKAATHAATVYTQKIMRQVSGQ